MFFQKLIDFYFFLCYNNIRDKGHPTPVWWNWQTRRTQNPKVAIPCRFDPDYRHQKIDKLLLVDFFIYCES